MVKNFTAKDKVLVHILDYYGIESTYTQPVEITQEGIAESVGLRQNTVSYAVRNLVKDGLLYDETHRIKGKKQKRKAYYLTEEGVEKAEEVKEDIENTPIKVDVDGEEKTVKIGQINTYFHTNLSVIDILKRTEDGKFQYTFDEEKDTYQCYGKDLVKPPEEEPIDFERITDWFESEGKLLFLFGDKGVGKTKYLSRFIEDIGNKTNVFYFKIRDWHTPFYIWKNISEYLERLGEHRLSSYIEASKTVNKEQVVADLRKDIKTYRSIFVIEDLDENDEVADFIKWLIEKMVSSEEIRFVLSQENEPDLEKLEYEKLKLSSDKNPDNLFDALKNHYGVYDEDRKEMLKKILDSNLTPEEYITLEYISLFREPIEKKEICKLKNVNKNLLNNLLETPLLDLTIEGKPILHKILKDFVYERMSYDTRISGHELAASYYSNKPTKSEYKIIEEIYHVAKVTDMGWFKDVLDRYAPRIIAGGYSSALLDIINMVKELLGAENIDIDLKFYEGEARRVNGDYSKALECYRAVMDHDESDPLIKTKANHGIAMVKENTRNYEDALEHYQSTENMVKDLKLDNRRELLGIANLRMGEIYSKIGRYVDAKEDLLKAIELLKEQNEYSYLTSAYLILAKLEKGNGKWKNALNYFQEGLEYWNNIDETYQRVGGLRKIGAFFKVMRELKDAEDFLNEAVETSERFGYEDIKASALLTLAECYIDSGEYEKAVESAEESNEIFFELDKEEELAYSNTLLGKAYMNMGDKDKAEDHLNKAITIYQKLGSSYYLGLTYFSMAKLQEKIENKEGVAKNYRKALLSFSGSGASSMAERVQEEMENIPISM